MAMISKKKPKKKPALMSTSRRPRVTSQVEHVMSSHIVHPHFTISFQDYTAITFGTLHHRLTRRNRQLSYCTHLALSKTLLSCSVRVHVLCRRRHLPNTRSVIWKERLVLHASETRKHQRFAAKVDELTASATNLAWGQPPGIESFVATVPPGSLKTTVGFGA